MNILRYILLLLAIAACNHLFAQGDTLYRPAIRLGIDVSGFARELVEPEISTREISLDYEWRDNFFAVLEAGISSVETEKESHIYQAKGRFIRAGADFNLLGARPGSLNDLVLISVRYGYSSMEHEAPFLVIPDPFWGDYQSTIAPEEFRAHWLEAGLGLKTELFSNIFIGWGLRGRVLLSRSGTEMEPFLIGGFGKPGNNTSLMLHYHISYRIPLR